MMNLGFAVVLALFSAPLARAEAPSQHPSHSLQVRKTIGADLEATGRELEALFKKAQGKLALPSGGGNPDPQQAKLQPIMEAGKKLYQWIDAVNASLPPGQKFSLSTPETQHASPIDKPTSYNVALIEGMMNDFLTQAPQAVKDVIVGGAPTTSSFPLPDDQFRTVGLLLDRAYSYAQRWLLVLPDIQDYREAKIDDVRGYYYLNAEPKLEDKLAGWGKLSQADRDRLKPDLVGICLNAGVSKGSCGFEFDIASLRGRVLPFYKKYIAAAQAAWNEFYTIPADAARKDITWKMSSPYVMSVPFLDPQNDVVKSFLVDNIQDEWKQGGWQLTLGFVPLADPNKTIHIKEVPGSLPHVNALGGNEITMDGNAPLSEYNVRWTIRHEYGHTLGFPDCYIEFFDDDTQAFVSYQLDITDLMCSRKGHFKDRHFQELKRVYLEL
jgi:hypothetical protein